QVSRAFEYMSKGNHIGKIVVNRETQKSSMAAFGEDALKDGILPHEGVEAFKRILAGRKLPQVVVSTTDLYTRIRESRVLPGTAFSGELDDGVSPGLKYDRPQLSTQYIAPRTGTEKKLGRIWQEFLGFKQVGINDDFFELGGDSLKAISFTGKIHKETHVELPLTEFFNMPTIKQLAEYIEANSSDTPGAGGFASVNPVEKKEYYPLSASQRRFYMFQQLDKDAVIYNMPEAVLLEGKLSKEKLQSVFLELIRRHESLRTSFITVDGEVVQKVNDRVEFDIAVGSGPSLPGDFVRPFDLSRAPLLRVDLIKTAEETHVLMMDMHHIISDGTSQTLFVEEFMSIYRGGELPPLTVQYKDYSLWQTGKEALEMLKKQEAYWLKAFEGELPQSNLPIDFPRPDVLRFEGGMLSFEIEPVETAALKQIASEEGVSLFGLVLTILNVLVAKITRREDIVIGTQVAGRRQSDLQRIIGVFLNSLALRNRPSPEKEFNAFLKEVMERTLTAFENQEY
ncbi:MAG: hypothetical protein GY950_30705, partial [bacterium]|nr:hypothetical protein [bacterium]